ncbi:THO complex subunit 2-like, partial [Trifolium medium]|nr:THO complex subunit 2-like [Trifolium medium]
DRCHGTLLQYVDFLGSAVTPGSNYAILIPSLDDLVHLYHLDPEVAFLIYRPVMRLFKSQRSPDVCWPLDDKNAASDSSTNFESDPADSSGSMVLDIGSNKKQIRL